MCASSAPAPSTSLPPLFSEEDDWTAAELPWGNPDPDTEIALSQPSQQTLSPQDIYTQVLPSIVCVEAERDGAYSVGSGVILTESGYIVTNYHVVEGGTALAVMLLSTEIYYDAVLIGYDEELDIAVLKIDAPGLVPASFGDSDLLEVGDAVYAIGNPMGYLYGTMTDGIVSSLARRVEIDEYNMYLIQTSVPLNSGNSGGALVNTSGQVVGITVAKITGMTGDTVVEGIGLVIPFTDALSFINHIIQNGTSCRPSLGILCYETILGDQRGILVDSTTPGTPAHKFLRAGDFIVAANGTPVPKLYNLTRILYATGIGNSVELTVLRNGEEVTVSILLYDRLALAQ